MQTIEYDGSPCGSMRLSAVLAFVQVLTLGACACTVGCKSDRGTRANAKINYRELSDVEIRTALEREIHNGVAIGELTSFLAQEGFKWRIEKEDGRSRIIAHRDVSLHFGIDEYWQVVAVVEEGRITDVDVAKRVTGF